MVELPPTGDDAEWSEDQIRDFLRQISEGAEIGRAIAAKRPPREQLAEALASWVEHVEETLAAILAYQASFAEESGLVWEHVEDDFPIEGQTVDSLAWRCIPSSVAETDLAAWLADGWPRSLLQPSHQQDRGPVLHLARRIVEAILDHLRGIAVLMADRRIVRPPLALARVVLDGAAHVSYLLEPDLPARDRLVRALNEVLSRAGEDYNQGFRDDNSGSIERAEQEITTIFDAIGTRLSSNWKKNGRALPFVGEKPASTGAMTRQLLDGGSLWNDLSGIVHLKEDQGWRLLLGAHFENPHRDSYLALHTLGALLGMARTVEVLAAYTGWDLSPIAEECRFLLTMWADGSGMFDDEHRAALRAGFAD